MLSRDVEKGITLLALADAGGNNYPVDIAVIHALIRSGYNVDQVSHGEFLRIWGKVNDLIAVLEK